MRYIYLFVAIPVLIILYHSFRYLIKNETLKKILDIITMLPMLPILLYSGIFMVRPLVTHASPEDRNRSIMTFLYLALILVVVWLLERRNKRIEKEAPKNISGAREILRTERRSFFLIDLIVFLLTRHGSAIRSDYEKDLYDICTFDKLVRAGEDVYFPRMRTKAGQKHWDRYIKAYVADRNAKAQGRDTEQELHANAILSAGGWKCSCGRANPSYTSTCVCGTNRRDDIIPAKR